MYWWGWSAQSRCEDAPYKTNSGGQLGEKLVSGGGGSWKWMQGLAMSHPHLQEAQMYFSSKKDEQELAAIRTFSSNNWWLIQ